MAALPGLRACVFGILSAPMVVACASAPESKAPDCEAVALNILVTDGGELVLNGARAELDDLRSTAREKARACEGGTPRGTFEGPNYATVVTSMIWPILREELPDLDLEMRYRGPGGR